MDDGQAPPGRTFFIRTAGVADTGAVRALDDLCFPAGDPDREPAPPGELEDAVLLGDVRLLIGETGPVAYVHADRHTRPDQIYISGVGVAPAYQRRGLGSRLIDDCLREVEPGTREQVPIVTITSPRNLVMLRLMLARGFRGRWYLPDYFGPGRDRLGCQLSRHGTVAPPWRTRRVSLDRVDELRAALATGREVVQEVSITGRAYVLAPLPAGDLLSGNPPHP